MQPRRGMIVAFIFTLSCKNASNLSTSINLLPSSSSTFQNLHPHRFSTVENSFLLVAGTFVFVALDFGAYLASKSAANLHHHVVHRFKFMFVDIKIVALVDRNHLL